RFEFVLLSVRAIPLFLTKEIVMNGMVIQTLNLCHFHVLCVREIRGVLRSTMLGGRCNNILRFTHTQIWNILLIHTTADTITHTTVYVSGSPVDSRIVGRGSEASE